MKLFEINSFDEPTERTSLRAKLKALDYLVNYYDNKLQVFFNKNILLSSLRANPTYDTYIDYKYLSKGGDTVSVDYWINHKFTKDNKEILNLVKKFTTSLTKRNLFLIKEYY